VRPDHLFSGTQSDNMCDMTRKRRRVSGERHGMAKLTRDNVLAVRRRFGAGETMTLLAADFGVSISRIYAIVTRQSWKEVA
jgi:hypothetical protein